MNVTKRVISDLTKCYSVCALQKDGKKHFVVASEKDFPCLLFDEHGNQEEQIWPGNPGGTMSLVPCPGGTGAFLATWKFYSPNDSKEAKIVKATPGPEGWQVEVLAELPHVHRFDLLERGGHYYLIACTICSGRDYKDDWSYPGKVYGCQVPDDPNQLSAAHPLQLEVLLDDQLKNHGYLRYVDHGQQTGIVTSERGVFQFTPPAAPGGQWEIQKLLDQPVSDVAMVDLDGDGVDELVTIGPFHGDWLKVYHARPGGYQEVYAHPQPLEFSHAIWGGMLCGRPAAVIGHRKGARDLCCLTYSKEGGFALEVLDHDVGPANVWHDVVDGQEILISTNREINEVAVYTLSEGGR